MPSTDLQDFGTPLLLEDYLAVTPPLTLSCVPACAACHVQTTLQRCSTCRAIQYCSTACQILDWHLHKLLCKQSAIHLRPDPSYRRALYLPDTKDKPRFVWLQYGDDGRPLDKAKCFPAVPGADIKTIAFHNRYLPYWIQISYDSNPSGREVKENESVKRLLGDTNGKAGLMWRGPLVVIAYSAEDGLSKPALDIDAGLLGSLVEYLKLRVEYGGPIFVEQPQKQYTEAEWKQLLAEVKR